MLLLVAVHARVGVVEDHVFGAARVETIEVVVEPPLWYLRGEEVARRDRRVGRYRGDRRKERLVARLADEGRALGRRAVGIATQVRVVEARSERDRSVDEGEREGAHEHQTDESPAKARAVRQGRKPEDRRPERERDDRCGVLVVVSVLAAVVREEQVAQRHDRRDEGGPRAKSEPESRSEEREDERDLRANLAT